MAVPCSRLNSSRTTLISISRPLQLRGYAQATPVSRPRFQEDVKYEQTKYTLPYTVRNNLENTRPQPRAPFAVRKRIPFSVNDKPQDLNAVYSELLGTQLQLSEDIKWQAVTHKSFDHGRQPFNEKLAFFGKTLLQMHACGHVLSRPRSDKYTYSKPFSYRSSEGSYYQAPEPFIPNDYQNLNAINRASVEDLYNQTAISNLIRSSGLLKVMRWKPAEAHDLERSGEMIIGQECLYAIVGAISLQKGGNAASQFIHTKILPQILNR
ncbi:ribonuclease-III-like-domain-containing protein [Geopyxis carbonaria]|nr:ribonuclease-III-like-domain-containing protein [Geopyxis carbonaria]